MLTPIRMRGHSLFFRLPPSKTDSELTVLFSAFTLFRDSVPSQAYFLSKMLRKHVSTSESSILASRHEPFSDFQTSKASNLSAIL